MPTPDGRRRTEMMNVLMTTDNVGGVWTYAMELCAALARHQVRVHLASMGTALSPAQRRDAAALENVTIHESAFKLEWMDDPWDDVDRAGRWLLAIEREVGPDVVHVNGYAHAALGFSAPVLAVGHSCVLSWWSAVRGENAPDTWNTYRRRVREGLERADVVVSPTRAMLRALERYYGPFRDGRIVPNGRGAGLFAPSGKEPFVFAAGRVWDEAKNIATLERVAPELDWPVIVAGEARHPDTNRAAALRHLQLVGNLDQPTLASWLGRASIYALPARYEPFGLSILEAALSGCALVLGDIESLRENWSNAAIFVPPDEPLAIARAIRSLIENDALRTGLAGRARQRARDFAPEAMAHGYLDIYRRLAPTSQPLEAGVARGLSGSLKENYDAPEG